MTAVKSANADCKDVPKPAKDRFPRIVVIVVLAEFCERFSYSAMRAFLTLYLRSKLGYSDDGATEIYHIFSTFVYVFPIFGGILADSYFGKFRTILNMMFIYAAGNLLVALAAIPQLDLPARYYETEMAHGLCALPSNQEILNFVLNPTLAKLYYTFLTLKSAFSRRCSCFVIALVTPVTSSPNTQWAIEEGSRHKSNRDCV
ncbi:Peptide transporter family 1 [Eumeta japonica]|uniref:Peptide transporter family 1 n=1 Tax=Eumeta variegata TaxID=151549 RepID=A0A4C1TZ39_EUMVA|nr:Peptide transporter family 1 [Eumeta japonica]